MRRHVNMPRGERWLCNAAELLGIALGIDLLVIAAESWTATYGPRVRGW